jgi:hypothetical protein
MVYKHSYEEEKETDYTNDDKAALKEFGHNYTGNGEEVAEPMTLETYIEIVEEMEPQLVGEEIVVEAKRMMKEEAEDEKLYEIIVCSLKDEFIVAWDSILGESNYSANYVRGFGYFTKIEMDCAYKGSKAFYSNECATNLCKKLNEEKVNFSSLIFETIMDFPIAEGICRKCGDKYLVYAGGKQMKSIHRKYGDKLHKFGRTEKSRYQLVMQGRNLDDITGFRTYLGHEETLKFIRESNCK